MMEYLKEIKLKDLPENYREIAEMIGLETALLLVELFGGSEVYFPKLESLTQEVRYRKIYEEYKISKSGKVYQDLARKYDYSESHIRSIIREYHARTIQKPKQRELF